MQYKWLVLTVTTIGVLMAGIDARIVIIGLPEVMAALKADVEQGIWINQAYLLGSVVVLLLVGKLTDLVGRKHIYTSGFAIFTVGSALTSIANDPLQVILFRVVQGIGAGIILTNSVALIVDATPKHELGFSLSMNNLGFRIGAMAGLTVSGVILSLIGDWRALFYINVPIGIFGTAWAHLSIKETVPSNNGERACVDWNGFFAFSLFVVSLLLALTFAAYGIASQIITFECAIISAVSLAAFVVYEKRCKNPLLDLKLLKIREYAGGILAQLINAVAWGAVLLLLSLHFQIVLGLSPIDAGLRIIPFDIAFLVLGPLSGKFSDRFGHLPFTTLGIVLSSISLYLFSTVDAATPYSLMVLYMVLFGAAIGIFSSPNMSSIMSSVPAERRGIASAFRVTVFNVGFAASLNLAVLIISLTVPYTLVTQITAGYVTSFTADKVLFVRGLKTTYLWLAALNATAIFPSVLRGKNTDRQVRESSAELGDFL
ncbi:MFS transporter [Candidatus Bathyarchaeota archaeon A05DMB-2]|nr:MFS transporter [Candidatus Bathyarchaeota archaeon A05DMB-2]